MDYERLYSARWADVRRTAFGWLDRIQHQRLRPSAAVAGLGVTFILICDRFKLDPRRVLEVADRMIRRADDTEPQYTRAIREYMRREMVE